MLRQQAREMNLASGSEATLSGRSRWVFSRGESPANGQLVASTVQFVATCEAPTNASA